jgi:hypothetical protein
MVTKKVNQDEKFQDQEFDLFEALAALDKKDYFYLDKLTVEQQKKFVPYMMTHWMSQVKSNGSVQSYYVLSVDHVANKHLFNEYVYKHPKLQWMMLCASSPELGKQFHQWVPHLSSKLTSLKETPKHKEIRDYFSKIYKNTDNKTLDELADVFVDTYKKKTYLAQEFPELKFDDIETLSNLISDHDIDDYERSKGN